MTVAPNVIPPPAALLNALTHNGDAGQIKCLDKASANVGVSPQWIDRRGRRIPCESRPLTESPAVPAKEPERTC